MERGRKTGEGGWEGRGYVWWGGGGKEKGWTGSEWGGGRGGVGGLGGGVR